MLRDKWVSRATLSARLPALPLLSSNIRSSIVLKRLAVSVALSFPVLGLAAQEISPIDSAAGLARFEQDFGPGWTVWHGPFGVPYRVFGPGAQLLPMPGVQTAEDGRTAIGHLLARHGAWLGVDAREVRETHFGEGRFVMGFNYQQTFQGVPVWNAYLKFVFNRGDGGLAILGSEAIPGLRVDMTRGLDHNDAVAQFMKLTGWRPQLGHMHHDPMLEIAPGDDDVYRLAWKVTGEFRDKPEAWSIWIDAKTGAELKRESQIHYCGFGKTGGDDACAPPPAPIVGNVSGWISPIPGGLTGINPPVLTPMADILVNVPGVGSGYTDANGDFSIAYSGTAAVNATIGLANGRWWSTVTDVSATPIQSQNVVLTPGVPTNIVFNAGGTEFTTSQVNAVHYAAQIHDYVKRVVPTMTAIDPVVTIQVNINQSCNAYFSGSSINFYRLAGSCNNTATASVVAHEYGHSVDARNGGIGSTPRTPSEGIGDVHSIYLQDNPDIGTDFYQASRPGIRNGNNSLTHPLTGSSQAVHTFGQPYMGWSWNVLNEMRLAYGAGPGYQFAEEALFESIVLNPRDMIDYILDAYASDDNDSNLNNGTPHIDALAKASLRRHFIRDVFHPVKVTHTPLADQVNGGSGFTIDANVSTTIGALTTVTLFFDPGTGSFASIPMVNQGGSLYRATSPAVADRKLARYYIDARNSLGNITRSPAESNDYHVFAVGQKTSVFADTFEAANANWTLGSTWSRHTPIGRNFDPNVAAGGNFVMGVNRSGTDERQVSASSGTQTLTSLAINTLGRTGMRLRFNRWATNSNNGQCNARVNGTAVVAATVPNDQAWKTFDVDVSALADNRASVVITFDNTVTTTDNVGGFTIDNVELYALNSPCPALFAYSPGLAGTSGIPVVAGSGGEPRIGNAAFGLALSNAALNAPMAWLIGGSTASIPIFGGTVAVTPDIVISTSTNGAGLASLPLGVPNNIGLVGQALFTQVGVADVVAVQGLALSAAMRITLCGQP